MIKKLKVKNYKSLKNIEIELGKFNVLIGPNASGKSNLLDSLAFLSDIIQGDLREKAINPRGGAGVITFAGEEWIELSIEFVGEEGLGSSNYLLSLRKEEIKEEKLSIGQAKAIDRTEKYAKGLCEDGQILDIGMPTYQTSASVCGSSKHYPLAQKFREYLSSWKSFQFITQEMRKNLRAQKTFTLERSGANLAQVLLSLHTERPKLFDKVEEMLKQGIPEVEELLTPLTEGGETFIALREKGFVQDFNYYQLSDGTLKLLAYITAVSLPEPQLLCFEEPENFVHPRLLQLTVEILKESEKQVILSTHSPYFINFVEPEDVIVVEKKEGETTVRRIEEPERLRKVLKEILLGELWYSGEFGGNP
jgi:predicted ATPase